jgi:prophage antirepressor-like protein
MKDLISNVTLFNFEGSEIRVVVGPNEDMFVAKDVASVLGYSDTAKAIAAHCKASMKVGESSTLHPQTVLIPERDIYRLVMRSKLPAAERFEEWIVSEVLPSIRKTGSYAMAGALVQRSPSLPDFSNPAEAARAWADQFERRVSLEQKIAADAPKVEALDRIAESDGEFNVREAAKDLKMPERKFVDWLIRHDWAFRNGRRKRLVGYREKEKAGYIRHDVKTMKDGDGEEFAATQMLFTAKGIARIAIEISAGDKEGRDLQSAGDLFADPRQRIASRTTSEARDAN